MVRPSEKEKLLHVKYMFNFLHNFMWNIYHSMKNSRWWYHKYTYVFMWSTHYYCDIWMKIEIFWPDIQKRKNTELWNFMESLQWQHRCSMWTDGETDMTNLTVASCTFAKAPQKPRKFVVWLRFYSRHRKMWIIKKCADLYFILI